MLPVLIRTVYTDLKSGKIENKVVLPAMLIGLIIDYAVGGREAVLAGVKMGLLITALLYILFFIGGLGAGDIKLLAVIGVLFPGEIISITAVAFILAGIWSAGMIVIRMIKKEKMLIKGETIHFSIPIAVAFITVMILNYKGLLIKSLFMKSV